MMKFLCKKFALGDSKIQAGGVPFQRAGKCHHVAALTLFPQQPLEEPKQMKPALPFLAVVFCFLDGLSVFMLARLAL